MKKGFETCIFFLWVTLSSSSLIFFSFNYFCRLMLLFSFEESEQVVKITDGQKKSAKRKRK